MGPLWSSADSQAAKQEYPPLGRALSGLSHLWDATWGLFFQFRVHLIRDAVLLFGDLPNLEDYPPHGVVPVNQFLVRCWELRRSVPQRLTPSPPALYMNLKRRTIYLALTRKGEGGFFSSKLILPTLNLIRKAHRPKT